MKQQVQPTIEQLEKLLRIDEHALEAALRDNADTFFKVSDSLALSISERDEAKQFMDEEEARVDLELRKKASMKEERTTEGDLASQRKSHPDIRKANDALLKLRHDAARWAALKESFEQRSYALSKLADLYIANYYSNNLENRSGRPPTIKDVKAEQNRAEMAVRRRERIQA